VAPQRAPILALRVAVFAILLAAGPTGAAGAATPEPPAPPAPAHRIVSMNPSLTRILVALGARDALVGVDDFSARAEPAVADLPRVGGLYSPSLEAVVALAPDLVVLVPSAEQRDFRKRLEALGVPVLELDPVSWDQVLETITTLGRRTGREAAARERVAAIRRARQAVERATAGLPRPRTVLVLQREPLFVVGRGSFLDEMLSIAGARNLGAELGEPWPRTSLEWLIAAAPQVLLDSDADPTPAATFWSRWPSLPAVAAGRVVPLDAGLVTLPGPNLDRALVRLAQALHGPALRLDAAVARASDAPSGARGAPQRGADAAPPRGAAR
jgi:iron complex transport system substrate-binding protein